MNLNVSVKLGPELLNELLINIRTEYGVNLKIKNSRYNYSISVP